MTYLGIAHPILSASSTDDKRRALEALIREKECEAANQLKCLHRSESGEISVSSTSPNINQFLFRRDY